jgi:hypothetical protein
MNIDDRLRAASRALKDSSVAQVDAASRLREIVRRTGQPVAHGRTAVLRDEPQESPRPLAPSLPPAAQPSRRPQRLAIAVSMLLVLALGFLLGSEARHGQHAVTVSPGPSASTIATTPPNVATRPKIQATTRVPDACLDAAELADEVISRLSRNVRDNRLALALRDYTLASQRCRREASP